MYDINTSFKLGDRIDLATMMESRSGDYVVDAVISNGSSRSTKGTSFLHIMRNERANIVVTLTQVVIIRLL